ncbi:MAG: hypothetical protein HQM04_15530 [Magnetococcales bacterium]|nr:hypothetical protein [Magnetococcales bacterium]MBF0116438.1 hypothetical protein [Magnetococcales bacterium]
MSNPESQAAAQLAASLHALLQESLRNVSPEWVASVMEEELLRLREPEPVSHDTEWPAEWNALIQQSFAPQIEEIARRLVRAEVRKMLPEVAERMVRQELQQL